MNSTGTINYAQNPYCIDGQAPRSLPTYKNRVHHLVELGQKRLFPNYEKRVAFAGVAAKVLDHSVFGVVGGMDGILMVDRIFHLNCTRPLFKTLPTILKVTAIPSAIFFFAMGIIEGISELMNLKNSVQFLYQMTKKSSEREHLNWIKSNYFALSECEISKIYDFVECSQLRALTDSTREEKAWRFDQIREKALTVKFEALSRRITPDLAKRLAEALENPSGIEECIIESLTRQLKVKTLVHALGLAAIALTLICVSSIFLGLSGGVFFTILAATSIALTTASFLLDKGRVNSEAVRFYDKIRAIRLKEAVLRHRPNLTAALAPSQS